MLMARAQADMAYCVLPQAVSKAGEVLEAVTACWMAAEKGAAEVLGNLQRSVLAPPVHFYLLLADMISIQAMMHHPSCASSTAFCRGTCNQSAGLQLNTMLASFHTTACRERCTCDSCSGATSLVHA